MSLARAFTTRKGRSPSDVSDMTSGPHRSNTTKGHNVMRHKISAPMQLVHTTNMLSYNAPDLPRHGHSASSVTSSRSDDDSDPQTPVDSTPPTSPDVSIAGSCNTPEPNHLSSYFLAPGKPMNPVLKAMEPPVPSIPKRSPSHTKKNSLDALARQRSISQMSRDSDRTMSSKASATFSRSSSTSTRASSTSHASSTNLTKAAAPPVPHATIVSPPPRPIPEHPFGKELAQVTELAEEYGVSTQVTVLEEDEQYLRSHGLAKLSAGDYLNDVQEIFATYFPNALTARPAAPMWI